MKEKQGSFPGFWRISADPAQQQPAGVGEEGVPHVPPLSDVGYTGKSRRSTDGEHRTPI